MTAALEQVGPAGADAKALLPALSEQAVLTTPAHQFALPEGVGNRVLAYSTVGSSGVLHTHIDQLVHELKKQHMRVVKLMTLFTFFVDKENPAAATSYAQGGTFKEILADSIGATWHSGGYSAGFDKAGKPTTVKSDWPTDYGALTDDDYITYNAHFVGIDYQGGVRRPIPAETLAAYYRNADLWDCAAALTVPFVDEDKDPIYREYYYNPLEGYDRRTLQRVANNMAKLNKEQFLKQNGAFYCSEGQFTVANLGPQEYSLVKKRAFGSTALGKLIDTFNAAPGYKDMPVEQRRRNPIIGWNYLKQLGPEKGGISPEQSEHLEETQRTAIYLEFIPDDVRGWQTYGPREKDGLIARPMTVATMAWSLLRRYMPREGVANTISADVMRAYRVGNPNVKKAVVALLGGQAPDTPEGQVALANISIRAATGTLIGLLASEEIKNSHPPQGRLCRGADQLGQVEGAARLRRLPGHSARCRLQLAGEPGCGAAVRRRAAQQPQGLAPPLQQEDQLRLPVAADAHEVRRSRLLRRLGAAAVHGSHRLHPLRDDGHEHQAGQGQRLSRVTVRAAALPRR